MLDAAARAAVDAELRAWLATWLATHELPAVVSLADVRADLDPMVRRLVDRFGPEAIDELRRRLPEVLGVRPHL